MGSDVLPHQANYSEHVPRNSRGGTNTWPRLTFRPYSGNLGYIRRTFNQVGTVEEFDITASENFT